MKLTDMFTSLVNYPTIREKYAVIPDFPTLLLRGLKVHPVTLNLTFRNHERGVFPFSGAWVRVDIPIWKRIEIKI